MTIGYQLLQWGRRNSPAETPAVRDAVDLPVGCFNGAAGIHRRKRTLGRSTTTTWHRLQWGRRNSPAETSRKRRPR